MASNLSSVPPVWPRPRPEIIGTKQPQAAATAPASATPCRPRRRWNACRRRGRSARRATNRGPRPFHLAAGQKRSAPTLSMPRKNTAMAKAAAWPSVMRAVSRGPSIWIARFRHRLQHTRRRVSSDDLCGSIRGPSRDHAIEQPAQGPRRRWRPTFIVCSWLMGASLMPAPRLVMMEKHRDLHADLARQDHFGPVDMPTATEPHHQAAQITSAGVSKCGPENQT